MITALLETWPLYIRIFIYTVGRRSCRSSSRTRSTPVLRSIQLLYLIHDSCTCRRILLASQQPQNTFYKYVHTRLECVYTHIHVYIHMPQDAASVTAALEHVLRIYAFTDRMYILAYTYKHIHMPQDVALVTAHLEYVLRTCRYTEWVYISVFLYTPIHRRMSLMSQHI